MRFLAAMGKCECIDALNDQSFAFTGLCDCSRFAKLALTSCLDVLPCRSPLSFFDKFFDKLTI